LPASAFGNPRDFPVRRALGRYAFISSDSDEAERRKKKRQETGEAIQAGSTMTPDEARELAHDWIKQIKQGIDPSREAKRVAQAAIDAERARQANSVSTVLDDYLKAKSHLRTVKALGIELRREMEPWLNRPISDITKRDITTLIHGIQARGRHGQARVIYGNIKGFFAWVIKSNNDYGLETSPCARINAEELVGHKVERERTLEDFEIRAFWNACTTLGYPNGAWYKLLLLTAVRRNEAAGASWLEFSPERWVIPASRMKGKPNKTRPHLVPITPAIEKLLGELPRFTGGQFLFSFKGGETPLVAFSRAKSELDEAMKAELAKEGHAFKNFRVHDIRRSCRTKFSELRIPGHISERLLAHTQPEIERRYDKFDYVDEKRKALVRWHDALEDIIEGRSNVVPLRAS
jgi:integrase